MKITFQQTLTAIILNLDLWLTEVEEQSPWKKKVVKINIRTQNFDILVL